MMLFGEFYSKIINVTGLHNRTKKISKSYLNTASLTERKTVVFNFFPQTKYISKVAIK